mmetsp:Transcript_41789/g.69809  ORF Transcript_41789/g.69809 Transcript_41789/m.69809 type:complete len:135 (-) Transcript_41789:549-953(-)
MDQRKVNMLAREYLDKNKAARKKYRFKPIILSHPMLMGLKQGQVKMSKSDPNSAIFMEDDASAVKKKIRQAYCPPGETKENPILDYCKHIIFNRNGKMTIKVGAKVHLCIVGISEDGFEPKYLNTSPSLYISHP